MPEIKHRQINPSPEIEYAEIYIPDNRNLGTGSFKLVTKPMLSTIKAISGVMINPPIFQISVNINTETGEIPVLLGRADGSDPISMKVYQLPGDVDFSKSHEFKATFENWKVTGLYMDGIPLKEKEYVETWVSQGGRIPLNKQIPEHEGTLIFRIPDPGFLQDIKKRILDDLFDLSKNFVVLDEEHGNTKIKIYRDTNFQFIYEHYNPTFGERKLIIDFADAKRQGARGFFIAAVWSPSKNSFYVGLYHTDPKFKELRKAFVFTKDKLKLIKETLQEFKRLLNEAEREEDIHKFLKENSILIGLTSTIEPISKFPLGSDYIVDFVIHEIPEGYILVEIERPGIKLFKKTLERTQEFNHAIEQLESWRDWVRRNHSYISQKLEGISPNPVCWLIAGRSVNLSKEEKERLKRINEEHEGKYKIFTYDDLVNRAKTVINKLA